MPTLEMVGAAKMHTQMAKDLPLIKTHLSFERPGSVESAL